MFRKILLALVVLIVALLVVISLRPDQFHIERSATIPAPAAVVFEQINDLHKFQLWSPWAKIDPNCKVVYAGPATGAGSSFTWAGNKEVGEGTMTISGSKPAEVVHFNLEFRKPFPATDTADFALKAKGNETMVTWSMDGKNNFISKAVGMFMDCDKLVGAQFEQGLGNLKTVSKEAAK